MPLQILAGVSAGLSLLSANKARKESKKASRAQQAIANLENEKARIDFIRQLRIATAQSLVGAVASGADIASSGAQGVLQSLRTQRKEGLDYQAERARLGAEANTRLASAQRYGSASGLLSTGASLALGINSLMPRNNPSSILSPVSPTATYRAINTSAFVGPPRPGSN